MKSLEKIYSVASHFEQKLYKLAGKVEDTGIVSSYVGGVVEPLMSENSPWYNKFTGAVQNAVNKAWEKNQALSGSVVLGDRDTYMLNANLVGGNWVVNPSSGIKRVSGSLKGNQYITTEMSKFLPSFNAALNAAVAKQLNAAKNQLKGDSINQEVIISGKMFVDI